MGELIHLTDYNRRPVEHSYSQEDPRQEEGSKSLKSLHLPSRTSPEDRERLEYQNLLTAFLYNLTQLPEFKQAYEEKTGKN